MVVVRPENLVLVDCSCGMDAVEVRADVVGVRENFVEDHAVVQHGDRGVLACEENYMGCGVMGRVPDSVMVGP